MMLSVAFAFVLSEEVHLRGVDTFSGIGNMYHVTHCWHGLLGQSVPRSNYLCVIVYIYVTPNQEVMTNNSGFLNVKRIKTR